MTASILDGIKARESFVPDLQKVFASGSRKATLAIIVMGEDAASAVYVRNKRAFGETLGVHVRIVALPQTISEQEVLAQIEHLNADDSIDGIIVQSPVPAHINFETVTNTVTEDKDVDGLRTDSSFVPATARGILSLLLFYTIEVKGKYIAVLGRSRLVGAPVAKLLQSAGAEVTVCHSQTPDVPSITRKADIVVVAIGKPQLVGREYFRDSQDQAVIDVGIHRTDNGLVGDVDFAEAKDMLAAITPVPGGVGPMTVLSLFANLSEAFQKHQKHMTRVI